MKERTIAEVVSAVSLWRLLYNGFNGANKKMSLDDAAKAVKMSRKSLDDYLMLLKQAKKLNFDFDRFNTDTKMGYLRKFVRIKRGLPKRTDNISDA